MPDKIIALIPARYGATRFPGKLLKILHGTSIITRTYHAVMQSGLFTEVYVVCDHPLIKEEIEKNGGKAIMSKVTHESGTDRIAEAAAGLQADLFINIQGDEPFIQKEALAKLIELFRNPEVSIASLMMHITDTEKIKDPNCVKVVTDLDHCALYFSRSPVPFPRDESEPAVYHQHIGVYAFRPKALQQITALPPSPLEKTEKLENLRMLENGFRVHMAVVTQVGIAIDTPEDLQKAYDFLLLQDRQSGDNAGKR